MFQDRPRVPDLHDTSFIEHHQPVAEHARQGDIVGDHDHSFGVRLGDLLQYLVDLPP